jgi:hypothetical protein
MTQEQTEQPKGFKLTMKVEGAAMRHFMELARRHDATGALDCLILTGQGQAAGELANGQKFEGEGSWELPIYVTFHAVAGGLGFIIAGEPARWKGKPMEKFASDVTIRNQEYSIPTPPELAEPESEKARSPLPAQLAQPTFYEARTGATAISDGRDLRDWKSIEGMIAMLHAPKDSIMQTRFEPCSLLLGWWGKPTGAELETLQCELQNLEFDALVTYFVCLSWAVEDFQVTTTLDLIIEAIGRGTDARRSAKVRQSLRAKVWRWMLLFDSLAVIGARRGTWREPRDGDKKREKVDPDKLYSRDALLKIIGTRDSEQGTFDNSTPPKEVTFVAGPWVNQWRGNREILSDFGNVRAIASIPRGKPSGAWAACIGFALNQKWREQAATAPITRITKGEKKVVTQKFRPFTRRVLLAQLWRSDVDPEEILKSEHPERAKEYWNAAIKILQKDGIIGFYKEIEALTVTGYGWQDAWLDQPLDIRPTGDNWKDAITISKSASAARKRGRKKIVLEEASASG